MKDEYSFARREQVRTISAPFLFDDLECAPRGADPPDCKSAVPCYDTKQMLRTYFMH